MPEFQLFLKAETREEYAEALRAITCSAGNVAAGSLAGVSWVAQEYRIDKSPLAYCINWRANAEVKTLLLASANPVGSLSQPMRLRVERVEVNEEAGEALVTGKLLGSVELTIHFFMPWFFLGGEEKVVEGAELSFRFCALALNAKSLRETQIETREGSFFDSCLAEWVAENPGADPAGAPPVTIDLSQLRAFLTEAPDVADFQLPASPATRLVSPFGAEIWRVEDYFLQVGGVNTLKLPLHIPAVGNPDYDPAAELPIHGRAWILGFLEGKAPGDFSPAKAVRKKAQPRTCKGGPKPRSSAQG